MEIISLKDIESDFSLSKLFEINGAVRRVIVVSAFIDIVSIKLLIDYLKKNGDLRSNICLKIYTDRSASRFYADKKINAEMLKIQNKIKNFFSEDSGVYLVQYGKLFHSKLFLVEGNRYGKFAIGSMNFTQKAMNGNEEILLIDSFLLNGRSNSNKICDWIKKYAETLNNNSQLVSKGNSNFPSCMRGFLLDGRIYSEMKERDPFRFDLFLPENILMQGVDIDPLLDSKINGSISLKSLITASQFGLNVQLPDIKSKIRWKKYCVETCYGYWSPSIFGEKLFEEFKSIKSVKKPYYEMCFDILNKRKFEIKDYFIKLCGRIKSKMSDMDANEWKFSDAHTAEDLWDRWYENLILKIDNKEFRDRLILGIYPAPAPDVWDDSVSSANFENSFCESIIYYWSKEYAQETSNIIAKKLSSNLNISNKGNFEAKDLKFELESWFSKNLKVSIFE